MMGDYTEFLRINADNAVNRRRKKMKELRRKNKKRRRQLNEHSLKSLEYSGLYAPSEVEKFDPDQPRDRRGRWTDTTGFDVPVTEPRRRDKDENVQYYTVDDGQDEDQMEEDLDLTYSYSSDGYSDPVTHRLRTGESDPDEVFDDEELDAMIDAFDRVGDRNILAEDTSFYRIVPGEIYDTEDGEIVTDPAFMSTTTFHQIAEKYRTNSDDVIVRFDLPKGSHIIPHRHNAFGASAKGEFMIPRGTPMRRVGREGNFVVYEPVYNVGKRWGRFDPRQPRDRRGRWTDGFGGLGMDAPNARRGHRDDVSPFPGGAPPARTRRATGARAAAPAKKTTAKKTTAPPAKKTAAKKTTAKKTTAAPAKKTTAKKTAAKKTAAAPSSASGLYDSTRRTVTARSSIPRINRGGTHIMQTADGRPLVANSYQDPGEAYYARNVGENRITNERLRIIFEDPSKMTNEERRMIASAGGAKSLDGTDTITVNTSRGPRDLDRYQVIGQLRSKIAPGSGDRTAQRAGISSEKREKMAAKRRESGKPSSTEFGKIEKQITEDWSTDGGKTVTCVFCKKAMSPRGMSVETPKPKALGGNYKDRGGRWPAHNACNTKAGEAAQKDPIAYQEEMMKKFSQLPADVRIRLPHVYDYFPQLGTYPGSAAQRKKYMARGQKS